MEIIKFSLILFIFSMLIISCGCRARENCYQLGEKTCYRKVMTKEILDSLAADGIIRHQLDQVNAKIYLAYENCIRSENENCFRRESP